MNLAYLRESASTVARKSYTIKDMAVAVAMLGVLAPLALLTITPALQESSNPVRTASIRLLDEALPVAESISGPSKFNAATAEEQTTYRMAVLDAMHPFDETDSEGREYSVLPLSDDSGEIVFCVAVNDGEQLSTYGFDPFCK